LEARPRARPPRGALITGAVVAGAGVLLFASRERGAELAAPRIEVDLVEQLPVMSAEPAPPAIPDLPQTPSSPLTRAAIAELAASADLRGAMSSENSSTPNGRLASAKLLQRAEDSMIHAHDLVVQSVSVARAAADSAPFDPVEHDQVRADVGAATDRTLMLAGRLRDTRLRAISAARRMLVFMEENAGAYEVRDGEVHFDQASEQVQFSHFQVNASRVLGQEWLVRSETVDALAEQEQLLARAGIR
jgi:hypothetical protein